MPSRTSPRRTTGERGAALVEFAIVLPLLAILAFGTIDIGRAYMAWNQVKGAAREGAAYAQFHPDRATTGADCADPDNVAFRAEAESPGQVITVKTTNAVGTTLVCRGALVVLPGERVLVTVERSFDIITPIADRLFGDPVRIAATVDVVAQGSG